MSEVRTFKKKTASAPAFLFFNKIDMIHITKTVTSHQTLIKSRSTLVSSPQKKKQREAKKTMSIEIQALANEFFDEDYAEAKRYIDTHPMDDPDADVYAYYSKQLGPGEFRGSGFQRDMDLITRLEKQLHEDYMYDATNGDALDQGGDAFRAGFFSKIKSVVTGKKKEKKKADSGGSDPKSSESEDKQKKDKKKKAESDDDDDPKSEPKKKKKKSLGSRLKDGLKAFRGGYYESYADEVKDGAGDYAGTTSGNPDLAAALRGEHVSQFKNRLAVDLGDSDDSSNEAIFSRAAPAHHHHHHHHRRVASESESAPRASRFKSRVSVDLEKLGGGDESSRGAPVGRRLSSAGTKQSQEPQVKRNPMRRDFPPPQVIYGKIGADRPRANPAAHIYGSEAPILSHRLSEITPVAEGGLLPVQPKLAQNPPAPAHDMGSYSDTGAGKPVLSHHIYSKSVTSTNYPRAADEDSNDETTDRDGLFNLLRQSKIPLVFSVFGEESSRRMPAHLYAALKSLASPQYSGVAKDELGMPLYLPHAQIADTANHLELAAIPKDLPDTTTMKLETTGPEYRISPVEVNGETRQNATGENLRVQYKNADGKAVRCTNFVNLKIKIPTSDFSVSESANKKTKPTILELGKTNKLIKSSNKDTYPFKQRVFELTLPESETDRIFRTKEPTGFVGSFFDTQVDEQVAVVLTYNGVTFNSLLFVYKC